MKDYKACCFTGHRPDSFPWKGDKDDPKQKELLFRIERAVDLALERGAKKFICGNAAGVDTWAAQIVLEKKKSNSDIVLEIAKPFASHNDFIPECADVCSKADNVHIVSDKKKGYPAAMFARNKYMVDNSSIIIAVYDGANKGGTKRTFEYAHKKGLEIIQVLWKDI